MYSLFEGELFYMFGVNRKIAHFTWDWYAREVFSVTKKEVPCSWGPVYIQALYWLKDAILQV